ncbi:MAG: bifunctional ornithine acetyltransferase/N-acetylglutamate synthase [Methanobacteriaceae archaeon]
MKEIKGGICAVKGVKASGSCEADYGVAVIYYPDSSAAAVFTSNRVQSSPIKVSKKTLKDGKISAIVANSGNANCMNGENGLKDAYKMARKVSTGLKINEDLIAVASTGIIGRELPMGIISQLIKQAIQQLQNSPKSSRNAAEAIMTTDTYPKEFAVETTLGNGLKIRIGGIAKGSGMIAPNMGTMLCFISTDLKASSHELTKALKQAVEKTFNLVVVDGDESTNDTVILMARPGLGHIDRFFQEALEYLCGELAKMMAQDGEGATKFMEVEIKGAKTLNDARKAAKAIVRSPLVKTALFGADPNWGRIVAAVGYSGADMDEKKISVSLSSEGRQVHIVKHGQIKAFDNTEELELAESIMERKEIKITVNLNLGEYQATSYGCDLSYDYVRINSEYST